ncbi:hypothetical protein [Massilia sp. erpn]|uniref:hypothetical protein n=1 Tax=Massilia sp. erpn TaxID=2738142 RepID=UPI002105E206|nr:hypothetical protein [Massilia sp. erpn]UTY55920.1 hypothetical protein HPQ68_01190 [Massilia sp. erpn]
MIKEVLMVLLVLIPVHTKAVEKIKPPFSASAEATVSKDKPGQKPERLSIPEERVPEPSPVAILATILLGLALVRMKH